MHKNERILVVAAHPDDEVLGCGGVISKARSVNIPVRVIFLAEGITARFAPEDFDSQEVRSKIDRRHRNGTKAMKLLGVDEKEIFFNTRYCCRLDSVPQIDITKEIEDHIHDFLPTKIYTHSEADANVDHRCAFWSMLAASRPIPSRPTVDVLTFEVLSSTEWNPTVPFAPNVFVDISQWLEAKLAAMVAYEDEMHLAPHPRSEEVIRALATYRGTQCGVKAAEGFRLVRSLADN
ncbi:PIG-L deacetylase family protein [Thalassospira alkalitolerans]|uniref:PIG-L deacetylase family protein n=1 Tax=Thalassospira alkalitolerans TaxID=1293890 RepID=UPI0030ECC307|tara:strand:- start:26911 stop:27615 length:705 start_codon:yes stop_codon:yes gene_type:complete